MLNDNSKAINSDFLDLEELLFDQKISPEKLEIPVPKYFQEENEKMLNARDQILSASLTKEHGNDLPEEEETVYRDPIDIDEESAIFCILKNERGRQGIQRGEEKKLERMKKKKKEVQGEYDPVVIVQKYFRAFADRKIVYDVRQEEMKFLGMIEEGDSEDDEIIEGHLLPDGMTKEKRLDDQVSKIRERRKGEQRRNFNKLQQEKKEMKEELIKKETPDMRDRMLQARREWITNFYEDHEGKELPTHVEDFYERNNVAKPLTKEEEEMKKKEEQQRKKEEKKAKEKRKKGKLTPQEQFIEDRKNLGPGNSKALPKIEEQIDKFTNEWTGENQTEEYNQEPDKQILHQELIPEIEKEIEVEVDALIKFELQNLYGELRIKKPKGFGKPRRDKKNKKNNKKNNKRRKVPGAKRVGNRHPSDLLVDCVKAGIAKKLKEAKISDFKGDHNFIRGKLQSQYEFQLDPSMAQLRQVCTEFVALPLGTGFNIEDVPQTFFFYGPPGTGKSLMVRALATETRALVLDISPRIVAGNFQSKAEREKMLYTVFTVAREYQPAIILINEAEHYFPAKKKKRKKKKGQPPPKVAGSCKKFKKDLIKQIKKNITTEDKVAVIACSSEPSLCNQRDIKKIFYKKFYFPYPDYPTTCMLFKDLVTKYGGKLEENFPISMLGHMIQGYTPGSVSYYS